MSSGSSRTPRPWFLTPHWNIAQSIYPLPRFSLPPLDFPGGGGNFRLPVMSSPVQEIIDLTSDRASPVQIQSRANLQSARPSHTNARNGPPPRFVRDVISIDDPQDGALDDNNEPEVQLLFARTLPNVWRQNALALDHPDQYQLLWRGRNQQPGRPRFEASPHIVNLPRGHFVQHDLAPDDGIMFTNADPQIDLPGNLDFMRQGFPMGNGPRARSYTPTYQAPPPPREGYTRSPTEDFMAICANCDEELGMGESELKKQVWVARKCGHVSTKIIDVAACCEANST